MAAAKTPSNARAAGARAAVRAGRTRSCARVVKRTFRRPEQRRHAELIRRRDELLDG